MRLFRNGFFRYGAGARAGKLLAAFLCLVAPASASEPVTVLAFGDSLTQGYGLPQEDGFVPQLRSWLDARDIEAEIINAGVSGDTTAGGAARVAWSLERQVDAMIVALGGNDLLRGIDPAVSRGHLEAILQEAGSRDIEVLLVGMRAPPNYGATYKSAFDGMYAELAATYDTLYAPDFFAGLGEGGPADLQRFFQSDGIHPNAAGVDRIVDALGPHVVELIEAVK